MLFFAMALLLVSYIKSFLFREEILKFCEEQVDDFESEIISQLDCLSLSSFTLWCSIRDK